MPLYEYYCEACDRVFEALRPFRHSDQATVCPGCGGEAERIMPTTFASMSRRGGYAQRVPYHHRPIRNDDPKRTIAPVRPNSAANPRVGSKRSQKLGEGKK